MPEASRGAYAAAGVDVAAGDRAVDLMRDAVESTRRPEVIGGIGGFGGAVTIPAGYREPVLVELDRWRRDEDGDRARRLGGTTRSASTSSRCAPTTSSAPARSRCSSSTTWRSAGSIHRRPRSSSRGVAAGCREAGCALVGGETAEHPGPDGPDGVRPRRLLRRRRRARPPDRRHRSPGRRRDRRARRERAPRERLLARAQPRRALGPAPRSAVPGAADADAGRGRDGGRDRTRSPSTRWRRSARCC